MQIRMVLVALILTSGALTLRAQSTPTPDFSGTATAIIREATQTAQAQEAITSSTPIQDPYLLTATVLIRQVTQTAEAATGRTAAPITAEAQADADRFELTATALIIEATQNASGISTTSDKANAQALSGTLLIFGGLIVALIILGVVVTIMGRRNSGKRK